jgi:hypothetical protein
MTKIKAKMIWAWREGNGQLGHGVWRRGATAIVDVREVHADRRLANPDLVVPGLARIELDKLHDVGASQRLDYDRLWHFFLPVMPAAARRQSRSAPSRLQRLVDPDPSPV